MSSFLPNFTLISRAARAALGVLVCLALAAPLRAQTTNPASDAEQAALRAKIYNEAMQAFVAQKWAEAASGIEKLIALITNPVEQSQMAPAYFNLCVAYFNQPNYPKAIEKIDLFITKFPANEKVMELRVSKGHALISTKKYDEAIKLYQELEKVPALRDKSLMAQVACYRGLKRPDEVVRVLTKLSTGEITTALQARGAVELAKLFAEAEEPDKAIQVLQKVSAKPQLIDNLVSLNVVAFKLGDGFLERHKIPQALGAYRTVRSREEVIKFQKDRVAMLEGWIEANNRVTGANPQQLGAAQMRNVELKEMLAESKALLAEFEKMPEYASSLLFREARCWYDWEKKWEALVVYERLLNRFPKAEEREQVLYSTVLCYADLHRVKSAQKACEQYLKEFPEGPNNGTVGYMAGAVALEAGDPAGAASFFGIMIEKQPNSPYREEMQMLIGHAKFAQGKWDEARADYEKYLTKYPAGQGAEEVEYRLACIDVFSGQYEQALGKLKDYLAKYPKGYYRPDAKYRIAVCYYAASQYDDVIKQCNEWLVEFEKDDMRGEVGSLLGDALAATNRNEEAARAYVASYKAATTDEVMTYSLFEASKQMQKAGQWEPLSYMFEEFVTEHPDHVAVVASLYWIGKAKAKLGHEEDAKEFLVDQLKKYINEPKREAVENILTQLAQLCSKRPRPTETTPAKPGTAAPPAVAPAPDAPGSKPESAPAAASTPSEAKPADAGAKSAPAEASPADPGTKPAEETAKPCGEDAKPADAGAKPVPAETKPAPAEAQSPPAAATPDSTAPAAPVAPEPPPYDAYAELDKRLEPIAGIANETGKARLLFARAEMATIKKDPRLHDKIFDEIVASFKVEDLSPVLCAYVGDFLMGKGTPKNRELAAACYNHLKEDFLKSEYLDYAYVGLGDIAYQEGKFEKALELYSYALDTIGASFRLKEGMIGKAKTLLELGKFDESRKLFEQIASVREWRGDTTAMAVFQLGEVELRRGKFPEAIAHYRRVFVAYQKYLPWVAKAYLKAAETFDKMGKRQDAIDNLRELLRNEKLQKQPEYEEAKKRLEGWGVTA